MTALLVSTIAAVLLLACGSGAQDPSPQSSRPASVHVVAGNNQSATASTQLSISPSVVVRDSSSRPLAGVTVSFNVLSGGDWVVAAQTVTNATGEATATWYMGAVANQPQALEARVGSLATSFTATSQRPSSGVVRLGFSDHVEWIPGDLPVVVSAPHDGTLLPTDIPDRTVATTTRASTPTNWHGRSPRRS